MSPCPPANRTPPAESWRSPDVLVEKLPPGIGAAISDERRRYSQSSAPHLVSDWRGRMNTKRGVILGLAVIAAHRSGGRVGQLQAGVRVKRRGLCSTSVSRSDPSATSTRRGRRLHVAGRVREQPARRVRWVSTTPTRSSLGDGLLDPPPARTLDLRTAKRPSSPGRGRIPRAGERGRPHDGPCGGAPVLLGQHSTRQRTEPLRSRPRSTSCTCGPGRTTARVLFADFNPAVSCEEYTGEPEAIGGH